MTERLFILVGANPANSGTKEPGGQLAVSKGVCEFVYSEGNHLEILDTWQSSFPPPPLKTRLKCSLMRIVKLFKLLSTRNVAGIIIFSSNGLSFFERILMAGISRLYRVRSVFFMLSGFFVAEMNHSLRRILAKWMLKIPSFVGIQGESWRVFYQHLGVPRIVTIMNWLPSNSMRAVQPIEIKKNERIRFCFIGWLVNEKGVRELLSAVKILLKKYRFEMVFVGGGALYSELYNDVAESSLANDVQFTGWVNPESVSTYLSESHVFVLPSYAEGFPMALLEAMSLGLPAICTNVGAISDSLLNDVNGFLLKECRVDLIAEAMERYLVEPELIVRHSTEALRIVNWQHDRDKNCKVLFDLFV